MTLTRRLAAIGAAAAMALPLTAAPASAAVISHDLKVVNVGNRAMRVCKHWSPTKDKTSTNSRDCYSEGSCRLRKGQNSRTTCSYRDTDGVRIDGGYSLMISKWGPDSAVRGCRQSTFFAKVTPSVLPGGKTKKLYLKKCRAFA